LPVTRLTHNAVVAFHRAVCPEDSISGAYHRLNRALQTARISEHPPTWLRHREASTDGYLILAGEEVVLPLRRGRAVSCLAEHRVLAIGSDAAICGLSTCTGPA
jgi:hypothetical protein